MFFLWLALIIVIIALFIYFWPLAIGLILLIILIKIIKKIRRNKKRVSNTATAIQPTYQQPAQQKREVQTVNKYTKKEFLKLEDHVAGRRPNTGSREVNKKFTERKKGRDYEGVYIIHNLTRNIYYVGQSKGVRSRARKHLDCKSHNKELNRDIARGHKFTVELRSREGSGFFDLDTMEMYYISMYEADTKGYNKTVGNI